MTYPLSTFFKYLSIVMFLPTSTVHEGLETIVVWEKGTKGI